MDKYTILNFRHNLKDRWLALTKLNWKYEPAPLPGADAIVCIDGTQYHGGLCDRLKGIITLYAYCKQRNLGFRIWHTHPFKLEDYLIPAEYDWLLKPNELSMNIRYSRFLHMRGENLATRLRELHTDKQIHYDGNRDCLKVLNEDKATDYQWGELFRELFKPAPDMAERLAMLRAKIDRPYNAAVFRFQNLLGDFKEYHYRSLKNEKTRDTLLNQCLDGLKAHITDSRRQPMLVTSDSVSFLSKASEIEGVFIIPGTLSHMGGASRKQLANPYEVYMKSFLDFYMLSEAQSIACIGTAQMYPSQFPFYAAKIYNRPFERITV